MGVLGLGWGGCCLWSRMASRNSGQLTGLPCWEKMLPLLAFAGMFLRGAGSPGIPSRSPPSTGKRREERKAVLIKE